MDIRKQIKEARVKLGFSQSQAAKAWGVPTATLQNWEHGRNEPRGLALTHLQQILNEALSADKPASGSSEPPASLAAPSAASKSSRTTKPGASGG